nr:chemosensory receptor [Caenorhabditis elegans]
MSLTKCASKLEIDRLISLNFRINQIIVLIPVFITFIFTYYAIKVVQKKSIFELSTKFLLIQNFFSANLHQVLYAIETIRRLHISLFETNQPCIPLKTEFECRLYLEVFVSGVAGMVYGQTGLLLERACATFIKNYEEKKSVRTGLAISVSVLCLSFITSRLIIWDDPLDGYQLTCISFPSDSVDRSSYFQSICTLLALFNLVTSILIWKYNKKFEYSTPFVVGPRFRKREVIDSTSTICFLTFVQFIFFLVVSLGFFIIKSIREIISYENYYLVAVWLYTPPYIAASFPILIFYRIRSSYANRVLIIKKFTNTKQTIEEHIQQMKNAWK